MITLSHHMQHARHCVLHCSAKLHLLLVAQGHKAVPALSLQKEVYFSAYCLIGLAGACYSAALLPAGSERQKVAQSEGERLREASRSARLQQAPQDAAAPGRNPWLRAKQPSH